MLCFSISCSKLSCRNSRRCWRSDCCAHRRSRRARRTGTRTRPGTRRAASTPLAGAPPAPCASTTCTPPRLLRLTSDYQVSDYQLIQPGHHPSSSLTFNALLGNPRKFLVLAAHGSRDLTKALLFFYFITTFILN